MSIENRGGTDRGGAGNGHRTQNSFAWQLTGILLVIGLLPLLMYDLLSQRVTEQAVMRLASEHNMQVLRSQQDYIGLALLHKPATERVSPDPRRIYATSTVTGRPSWVNRLSSATRTWSSVT